MICVDLLIRLIPGKHDFRIQDSNAFLASSLSLSFGVMVSLGPSLPHLIVHAVVLSGLIISVHVDIHVVI